MARAYRFFFHYNKPNEKVSVHWRGRCYLVTGLTCLVPCEAKFNHTQPKMVMQGFAKSLEVNHSRNHARID